MTESDVEEWQPGTAADLVADALALGDPNASLRLITNWTERGILAPPAFRKSTRHGSDARLYSADQRRLFTELIKARQRSSLARVPFTTLIRPVLYIWLTDDTVIPHVQARRAWRTWAGPVGKNNASRRRETARMVVDQFAHTTASPRQRRKAQLVLEQGAKTRAPEWDKVYSALTEICSPWALAPGHRIERAIGTPDLPIGVAEAIGLWELTWKVTRLLATEQVPEPVLVRARAEHRRRWKEYQAARPHLERATNREMFAKPTDVEQQIKEHVEGFVPVLGHDLGLAPDVSGWARDLRSR